MTTSNKTTLTASNAKSLIGKKIQWNAPADSANAPYSGIAIITAVSDDNYRPLTVQTIDGDDLKYAFLVDGEFNYSDGDRLVTFSVIEPNPDHAYQKGEVINGVILKYGIPKKVVEIYGSLIRFRNLEMLDGEGTGAAQEDVEELRRLVKMSAIK